VLCGSLMNNDGIFRGNNVIKHVAEEAVVKVEIGRAVTIPRCEYGRPT
jgi:hypothetical protein